MSIEKNLISVSKTALYVILTLIFTIIVFLLIMSNLPDVDYLTQENFYLQELPNKNNIFLLGSSHIFPLDELFIEDNLKKKQKDYSVYNLGLGSDDPENRSRTIDMVISKNPKIIVYGIDYRDFASAGRTYQTNDIQLLPIIPKFDNILEIVVPSLNNGILNNPKFAFIRTISILFESDKLDTKINEKHPFFERLDVYSVSTDPSILQKTEFIQRSLVWSINSPNSNINFHILKNMITQIQNNNIQLVVFTTPHSIYFLESLSESQKNNFNLILNELNQSLDIPIYELHNKYKQNNVWYDNTHLAINNETNFFSEDISKLLLQIDS